MHDRTDVCRAFGAWGFLHWECCSSGGKSTDGRKMGAREHDRHYTWRPSVPWGSRRALQTKDESWCRRRGKKRREIHCDRSDSFDSRPFVRRGKWSPGVQYRESGQDDLDRRNHSRPRASTSNWKTSPGVSQSRQMGSYRANFWWYRILGARREITQGTFKW